MLIVDHTKLRLDLQPKVTKIPKIFSYP